MSVCVEAGSSGTGTLFNRSKTCLTLPEGLLNEPKAHLSDHDRDGHLHKDIGSTTKSWKFPSDHAKHGQVPDIEPIGDEPHSYDRPPRQQAYNERPSLDVGVPTEEVVGPTLIPSYQRPESSGSNGFGPHPQKTPVGRHAS